MFAPTITFDESPWQSCFRQLREYKLSRKLRNLKPRKVDRGAFEEQKLREENKLETQRAMLFILPLIMLALLAVGVFFGYKFYQDSVSEISPVAPSEYGDTEDYSSDPLFLRAVSSAAPLSADVAPELVESCGVEVSPAAAESLRGLRDAAADNGFDLIIAEGYISYEEQSERYNEAVESYRKSSGSSLVMAEAHVRREIPPAGESEQQTGLVVWLSVKTDGKFADTPAYSWLIRNCVDYGFVQRYPERENAGGMSFSSHLFRFVGRGNAYNMRALNMNFDEYISYLRAQ